MAGQPPENGGHNQLCPAGAKPPSQVVQAGKLPWNKALQELLKRNPNLRIIDHPEKLEYFRNDLNVDLPPLIRDLMLKSLPDLVFQPTTEEHLIDIFSLARQEKIPVTVRGAGT